MVHMVTDNINLRLKVALARKGLNQFPCAMITGVSPGELSIIMRGYKRPTKGQLLKFEKLFSKKQLERIFDIEEKEAAAN